MNRRVIFNRLLRLALTYSKLETETIPGKTCAKEVVDISGGKNVGQ